MDFPVISFRDVRRYYLVGENVIRALDGISFDIPQGDFLAIMGPSGSGKSTLMNLIGCLDTPTSGIIRIEGEALGEMDEEELAMIRNRKIGFVFQNFNLLPRLSALDNVMVPLLYRGVSYRERKEKAESLLEKVGLKDRMRHRPTELSGGQKQRVAIARALSNNPSIILADEPTGALDSRIGNQIMEIFESLNEEGRPIVFVTHDISLGKRCHSSVSIRDGRIVDGS